MSNPCPKCGEKVMIEEYKTHSHCRKCGKDWYPNNSVVYAKIFESFRDISDAIKKRNKGPCANCGRDMYYAGRHMCWICYQAAKPFGPMSSEEKAALKKVRGIVNSPSFNSYARRPKSLRMIKNKVGDGARV